MNIYDYTTPKTSETFTTLIEHKNIKINRIVSSSDVKAIEYVQEEDEWLVVLEGEALIHLNDEKKILSKGDTLFIPAKTPHKVLHIEAGTLWLTVHIF